MAEIYLKPTVAWYEEQVGYSSGSSKSSKYSKEMDSCNFYNTKKNGYANWCGIFYDTGIKENAIDASVDEVRAMVYEPNKDNCGAGCAQKIGYYKSHNAWYPHKVKGCPAQIGDEIFFGSPEYKNSSNPLGAYHTGAVVDWDSKGLYTVEGNTNGKGDVSRRFYSYSDSRILGFGRPNWTGLQPETEKPVDEKPEPAEPAPAPEPVVPDPEPAPSEPEKPSKSVDELAKEVIEGKWGNGKARAEKLTAAGYDYQAVQDRVNEILGVGKPSGQKYKVCNVNSFLRIRSTPSDANNYNIIGKLFNNDKVTVYEEKNGWARIGQGKWCSMDYLTKA